MTESEMVKVLEKHPGLLTWIVEDQDWDLSAAAIIEHLTGISRRHVQKGAWPCSLGEFWRCLRLLDAVPTLRRDLLSMAYYGRGEWKFIVDRWGELTDVAESRDVDPQKFARRLYLMAQDGIRLAAKCKK